jgi:hypothetical protein
MNDNSYSISSDDSNYDGWSSNINYFNWYTFENDASDGGFFELNQTDENPNYVLSYTRLEQSNTISVEQIPQTFDVATGWIKMLYDVFSYQQRILSIDYDVNVWPVASQMYIMESYPERYGISVLFQRGNDGLRCCFSQNISIFVGVDFDMNYIEAWMGNSTYSDSVHVQQFAMGNSTTVSFPHFLLRNGTHAEIQAYPLDRVTFMIILENGMALLTSLGNGFQDFVFQTEVQDATKYLHDYIPYTSIDQTQCDCTTDTDTDGNLKLPIPFLYVILGLISIKLIYRKR